MVGAEYAFHRVCMYACMHACIHVCILLTVAGVHDVAYVLFSAAGVLEAGNEAWHVLRAMLQGVALSCAAAGDAPGKPLCKKKKNCMH